MATDVGEAVIKLSLDTKGYDSKVKSVSGAVTGALGSVAKAAVAAGTAITGALTAGILSKGFDRATNIEEAQFKLQGLGHSAENVSAIMDNALTSVKGTAFGLGDAATIAASAVAAGVKPGQELERTLSLVGDAAAIAGTDLSDMGAIFNKVAAGGKISAEEINQLTDRGIPVLQLLGQSLGKTTEEVRAMVSAGQIGFAEFQNAIEQGMGGAAKTMGQTWSGSVANLQAAMGRMGQSILTPFLQNMTPVVGEITSLFDDIMSGSTDNIDATLASIQSNLTSALQGLINNLAPILEKAVPVVTSLIETIASMLPGLITQILPIILNSATQIILSLARALPGLITGIVPPLLNAIISILPALAQGATQLVIDLATQLSSPEFLAMVLDAGLQLLMALVLAIPPTITAFIEALPQIIANIVSFLTNPDTILMLVDAGIQLFFGLVNAVPQIAGALINSFSILIGTLINNLLSMFSNFAANFGEKIGGIFKNVVNGVLGFIENLVNGPIRVINGFIDTINGAFGFIGVNLGRIGEINLPRLATGGMVVGPGTGTSDSIPALLSDGEYVINAKAAKEFGYNNLDALNSGNTIGILSSMLRNDDFADNGAEGKVINVTQNVYINNEMDAEDIGRKLMTSIRRAA